MSVTLRIAAAADLERLDRMAAAYREELGLGQAAEDRRAAMETLIEGTPHGVAYLIGPPSSPVGYLVLSFGYAPDRAGLEARVQELFVRPAVRRRGMGGEALSALGQALSRHGVRALHVEAPEGDASLRKLAQRQGFRPRDGACPLTLPLRGR